MPLDLLLVTVLVVAVLTIVVMLIRRRSPLSVSLNVGQGRQVKIGGRAFPPDGPAGQPQRFSVPRELLSVIDDDVVVAIESHSGAAGRSVSVSRKGLRSLQIDASLNSGLVVYGCYEQPVMRTMAYAATPKCIECGDGIIVCSLNPKCR